jgi:hypothetical protein
MNTVTSSDGTTIAYDVAGSGPTVVIVDGALTTRSSGSKPELVRFLSQHLTVYSYDRRIAETTQPMLLIVKSRISKRWSQAPEERRASMAIRLAQRLRSRRL